MEPSPSSHQALETTTKNSSQNRPVSSFFVDRNKQQTLWNKGKTLTQKSLGGPLSEKIGIDGDDDDAESSPSAMNGSRHKTKMSAIEEGIVGEIMSVESILNDTTTKD